MGFIYGKKYQKTIRKANQLVKMTMIIVKIDQIKGFAKIQTLMKRGKGSMLSAR
jgi:hypothetical protein